MVRANFEYPAEAYELRDQLLERVLAARSQSIELAWSSELREEALPRIFHEWEGPTTPNGRAITEVVRALDSVLEGMPSAPELPESFTAADWSIATEFVALRPREIHLGYVVPVVELPARVEITSKFMAFITINGDRDYLVRENHGFGMHYHYVLADKRRTTTLICWDTNWVSPEIADPKGKKSRPLFHQPHNDNSGGVHARPHRWGDKKRQSVRTACVPDLGRQKIVDFLCAGADAEAVWPKVKSVSPKPLPSIAIPTQPAPIKLRHGKGRG